MKLAVYASISILVLFGTIMHTFIIHEHFYPTLVALSQEKLLLAVIYNFLFMLLITLMQALITLFVGSLAPIEMEQLVENGRGMVADTLLFLVFFSPTVNGRELSTLQLVQFIGVILVLKIYHSVAQIRTSRMFEIGLPTNTVILRVGSLLILLSSIDIGMLTYIAGLLEKTSTFYTWILFDFINISIGSVSTLIKFVLNMVDVKWSAQGWPSKSVYIFYTELVSDILQMTSYILFMGIFFTRIRPGFPSTLLPTCYKLHVSLPVASSLSSATGRSLATWKPDSPTLPRRRCKLLSLVLSVGTR